MESGRRQYSVLVVSASPKLREALQPLLPGDIYAPAAFVPSAGAAREMLRAQRYDLVIVNVGASPEEPGIALASEVCGGTGTVALLLAPSQLCPRIAADLEAAGVYLLPKPTSSQALQLSLRFLVASRERLRRLEENAAAVEKKMEELRLVNRAKWLLIGNLKMTESDAHRYIEKQAMDRCVSRREIALNIIRTYE